MSQFGFSNHSLKHKQNRNLIKESPLQLGRLRAVSKADWRPEKGGTQIPETRKKDS